MRFQSRIRVSGITICAGAEFGIKEKHTALRPKLTPWATWNDVTKLSGRRFQKRKQVIELTASDVRWTPGWENLGEGDPVTLWSSKFVGVTIPPGVDNVTTRFAPVPCDITRNPAGFVVIATRESDGVVLPVSVNGRTHTLTGGAQTVSVDLKILPIRPCLVADIDEGDADQVAGKESWGLTLVDVQ